MSAWIVTSAHIDVLINKALELGLVDRRSTLDELSALGQMLWDENHASVNYRYDEDTESPRYRFVGTEKPLLGSAVLRAAHSLDYQSCEHPGWDESRACAWVGALIRKLDAVGVRFRPEGPGWSVRSIDDIPVADLEVV
jgi:hypothetical protein